MVGRCVCVWGGGGGGARGLVGRCVWGGGGGGVGGMGVCVCLLGGGGGGGFGERGGGLPDAHRQRSDDRSAVPLDDPWSAAMVPVGPKNCIQGRCGPGEARSKRCCC